MGSLRLWRSASAPNQVAGTQAGVSHMSGQHSMQQCWDTLGIIQFSPVVHSYHAGQHDTGIFQICGGEKGTTRGGMTRDVAFHFDSASLVFFIFTLVWYLHLWVGENGSFMS